MIERSEGPDDAAERSEGPDGAAATPTPTGRIVTTSGGTDLVLTRTFRAPVEDVWASVTEPARVARWFGRWSGECAVGAAVQVAMTAEEGDATSTALIKACEPPSHLALSVLDEAGRWELELHLRESGGETTLQLVHHLDPPALGVEAGPGWEWYLDRLGASREDVAMPDFDDYWPAMKPYFEAQLGGADRKPPPPLPTGR